MKYIIRIQFSFLIVNTCLSNPDVTSWRDGGGRALAPTIAGEGVAEGGVGGAMGIEGAPGGALLPSPLPQPGVGPQFPPYRGILPPFVSTKNFTTLYNLGRNTSFPNVCD